MQEQDEGLLTLSESPTPGKDLSATSFLLSKDQVPTWRKDKAHLEAVLLGAVPGGDTPQPPSDPNTAKRSKTALSSDSSGVLARHLSIYK